MCTYFGLFGGDLTVTFGETPCVAHRIANGRTYCIGADDEDEGQDRGRRDEVPLQRRRSYAALHGCWLNVQSPMRFSCRGPNRCARAPAVCDTRRLQPITIRDGGDGCVSVCRRQVFQTTTPPLLPPPPPPPPTPPTPPPPPPMPKTADRSSNPPTHQSASLLYLRSCASALAEYCCKRGWRCRLQRLRQQYRYTGCTTEHAQPHIRSYTLTTSLCSSSSV